MSKIAIVTDSTAYLSPETIDKYNIFIIPLTVSFGQETFEEGKGISNEDFFSRMAQEKVLPTSSQPSVGQFIELYEKISKEYDEIISIHVSRKLTGAYQSAMSVSKEIKNVKVHPVDSTLTTGAMGLLVIEAAKMVEQGKSSQEILNQIHLMVDNIKGYFLVDDLTNLIKGGRLSKGAGSLAGLLKIKPVLTIKDGEIILFDKIRTKKKALQSISEEIEKILEKAESPQQAIIIYSTSLDEAESFQNNLQNKFPSIRFNAPSELGPVIATHLGQGMLGVAITIDAYKV